MFFDSLRIKDAVWGWGSRQLGHRMKQYLHEPFVSTTKTLGILEFWTFFFVWSIKISTFWLKLSKQDRWPMIFSMFFVVKSPGGIGIVMNIEFFVGFLCRDEIRWRFWLDRIILSWEFFGYPSPMLGIFVRDNDGFFASPLNEAYPFLGGVAFLGGSEVVRLAAGTVEDIQCE